MPTVSRRNRVLVVLGALLALAIAAPYIGPFLLILLMQALIFGILTMSVDVLLGFTGLPSLGQAAYLGVGAYLTAILATRYDIGLGWDFILVLGLGVLAAALTAALFGSMEELTRNGAYHERAANGNLCLVTLFKNFRCGLICLLGGLPGGMEARPAWPLPLSLDSHRHQSSGTRGGVSVPHRTDGYDHTTRRVSHQWVWVTAQYERALARERIMAGLEAAKRRGKRGGRPHAISNETLEVIREAMKNGTSKAAICGTLGVKRSTLYDALARQAPEPHHRTRLLKIVRLF